MSEHDNGWATGTPRHQQGDTSEWSSPAATDSPYKSEIVSGAPAPVSAPAATGTGTAEQPATGYPSGAYPTYQQAAYQQQAGYQQTGYQQPTYQQPGQA